MFTWRKILQYEGRQVARHHHHLGPGPAEVTLHLVVLHRGVVTLSTDTSAHQRLVADVVLSEEGIFWGNPLQSDCVVLHCQDAQVACWVGKDGRVAGLGL